MSNEVFIYCRVAANDHTSNAVLEQQESDCREYCGHHGFIVAGVFRDIGSGLHWQNRDAFTRMREKYLNGEVTGVVVLNRSRISRNLQHYTLLVQEMKQHNVTLYCAGKTEDMALFIHEKEAQTVRRIFNIQ